MNRRIKHIHFVGVGGIGMCGLAELLHNQGYRGDAARTCATGATVERLRSLGIPISIGHARGHVGEADVVVLLVGRARQQPRAAAKPRAARSR